MGCVEKRNEPWGSIKCGGCIDYLRKCWVFEIGSVTWLVGDIDK
jgi:hypothetical protein